MNTGALSERSIKTIVNTVYETRFVWKYGKTSFVRL